MWLGSFHHPAIPSQSLTPFDATPGDPRDDPSPAARFTTPRVGVAVVRVQLERTATGPSMSPLGLVDRRDGIERRVHEPRIAHWPLREPLRAGCHSDRR